MEIYHIKQLPPKIFTKKRGRCFSYYTCTVAFITLQVHPDLVPDRVHLMCSLQCQQSGLLYFHTGLRNVRQDGPLFRQRLPKSHSLLHLLQVTSCDASHTPTYIHMYTTCGGLTLVVMRPRALSAIPISLMQWWILPGPSLPCAV